MQRLRGAFRTLCVLRSESAVPCPLIVSGRQHTSPRDIPASWLHSKGILAFDELTVQGVEDPSSGPNQTAVFIHGLLGAGRNWRSFARRVGEAAADQTGRGWRFILLDLRNHGDSARLPGFHPPHHIHTAAEDVIELINQKLDGKMPDVVVGHSLGGKVTLSFLDLLQKGHHDLRPPKQLWVLDSDPGTMPINADKDVDRVLHEISDISLPVPSRKWLNDFMQQKGFSMGLAQWLGSNLVTSSSSELVWTFKLEGAAAMYNNYRVASYWHVLERVPQGTCLNMVVAQNSDRFTPEMMAQLASAKESSRSSPGTLCCHVLPKAGHWLHVDNPGGLSKMMLPSFTNPEQPTCQD